MIEQAYKEDFGDASELAPILGYLQRMSATHPRRWRIDVPSDPAVDQDGVTTKASERGEFVAL